MAKLVSGPPRGEKEIVSKRAPRRGVAKDRLDDGLVGIQQAGVFRTADHGEGGVVREPRAHTLDIAQKLDAVALEFVAGADAGAHEDCRGLECSGAQDDRARAVDFDVAVRLYLDTHRTGPFEDDAPGERVRPNTEVGTGTGGRKVTDGR
mgnify:CR=1 FL=1